MSKNFQTISKHFAILTVLLLSVFNFVAFNNPKVQALTGQDGIGINPTNSDAAEKFTKGWFVEKLNPGEQVERSVTVSNYSDEEKRVILQGEDYLAGDQGSFSYSDKEELKATGKWIQIDAAPVIVPAKKAVNVKFKVAIPKDIKPGEYAGVLAVQEAPKDNKTSGFSVVSRLGARIYITVPGNLETGFKFNNFKFITPDTNQFYKDFLSSNFNSPFDNMFLTLDFKNAGNVFAKLKGKVEVTGPSGKTSSTNFDRDYAAFDPNITVKYLPVNDMKWSAGKFKAKFTFENPAVIQSNKGDIKNVSPTQVVETEFEMTQAILDQLKTDINKAGENKNVPKIESKKEKSEEGLVIKEAETPKNEDKKDETKSDLTPYFVGGGVALAVVLVAGIVIFVIAKKGKVKEKASEEKKTDLK